MDNFKYDVHAQIGSSSGSSNFSPGESCPFSVSDPTSFFLNVETEIPFSYPELDSIFDPQDDDQFHVFPPPVMKPFTTPTPSSAITTTTATTAVVAPSPRPKVKKSKARSLSFEEIYKRKLKKKSSKKISSVHEVGDGKQIEDVWAWKKNGQNFTKDSPYLRSYFKCSTSDECFARKVVQQTSEVPEKFIVTYTGLHVHPPPNTENPIRGCYKPLRAKRSMEGGGGSNNASSSSSTMTNQTYDNAALTPISSDHYHSSANTTFSEMMMMFSSEGEVTEEARDGEVEELGEDLFLHDDVNGDASLGDDEFFEGIEELHKKFFCD
uniref:WRKY domain-containing protein n=1 Tax=Kalanchoe fedtschenkoi TaxID=63787 RepID=A0A7N0U698_KALFE